MAVLVGLALMSAVSVIDVEGFANSGSASFESPTREPEPSPPPPPPDAFDRRLDCIMRYESRGYAGAYNRSSGASGLLQFLPSTWRSTPQGRAGLSIWDAEAQWAAGRWMLQQGRAREWVPVQRGLC